MASKVCFDLSPLPRTLAPVEGAGAGALSEPCSSGHCFTNDRNVFAANFCHDFLPHYSLRLRAALATRRTSSLSFIAHAVLSRAVVLLPKLSQKRFRLFPTAPYPPAAQQAPVTVQPGAIAGDHAVAWVCAGTASRTAPRHARFCCQRRSRVCEQQRQRKAKPRNGGYAAAPGFADSFVTALLWCSCRRRHHRRRTSYCC